MDLPELPEDKRNLYTLPSILSAASAASVSVDPPHPDTRLDSLTPLASTESARLFRCVLKRPNFTWENFDGVWMSSGRMTEISFSNELRLLRTLRPHVNIVRFLGMVDDMGILLELVEGVQLAVHLKPSSPIAHRTKAHWINQMIDALCHIHSFSLSHGDVSPGNVLVTSTDIIKMVDFGRSTMKGERLFPTTAPFDPCGEFVMLVLFSHNLTVPPPENNDPMADPILLDAYAFGVLVLCIDANEYLRTADISRVKDFGHLTSMYVRPLNTRERIRLSHRISVTSDT
jgi:serine/threonine protein kinase